MESLIGANIGGVNCPSCAEKYERLKLKGAHVIWESVEKREPDCIEITDITVDQSPFLFEIFERTFKTFPIRLEKMQDGKKNTFDYKVSCPVCSEFTIEYKDIPKAADVYVLADRGEHIATFDFIPDNKE
ncbi:MAG: hypothetical protein CL873_04375 [Dehalococcoidales bacterium]|jgi:hypothetical protein|nr:hypothetical protein [Dehalococcoidales bacterium]|tara:strand:- start:2393 stop:2782 length:390 start_codon:yes stop_codon:yes gene_type:complete